MSKKHHTTPENTENKVTAEGDDAPKLASVAARAAPVAHGCSYGCLYGCS